MESVITIISEQPKLNDPILIEGLPGVGNVGKLAAEHLLDNIEAVKFADIYSKHFPPQVVLDENCVIEMVNNELYYAKGVGDGKDLIILVGDYQGLTPEGQYELAYHIIQMCLELGVKMIFTLGGYGVGKMVEEPRVLGAVTDLEIREKLEAHNVVFSAGEPGSGIVGASGLLLGLGKIFNINAACLMGETSGYFVDPKGAEAVLHVLNSIIGLEIDMSELESKAKQIDQITSKIKDMESPSEPDRDDLGYIG
ncbi:MAG: uncharacterized protein PWQ62_1246 [Candidatus Methanomethylophilaceae archaeon]|nr:uncharacterized protein [Candidatus Methanomethylophilaceae archaeon]